MPMFPLGPSERGTQQDHDAPNHAESRPCPVYTPLYLRHQQFPRSRELLRGRRTPQPEEAVHPLPPSPPQTAYRSLAAAAARGGPEVHGPHESGAPHPAAVPAADIDQRHRLLE
ncbi:MAG TPA: hypothetical protein VMN36_17555 [Verrucomicrobiales bacterium]|nr:hypothetical protein [Verrucomicrobiales bacterium]